MVLFSKVFIEAAKTISGGKLETNDREVFRDLMAKANNIMTSLGINEYDLVDKANQNDIQPEKIQLEVQKKNEVIEKIEELCQENIWL
jgi:hypothetical protein